MKIVSLIQTISHIQQNLTVQQNFLRENIIPLLDVARENNDGSLDASDFKKITNYYGLAVPAILAESFCVLHGRKLTEKERWTATCQGAMTGLFDDFFDKNFLDKHAILLKTLRKTEAGEKKQNEKLFEIFYDYAFQHIHDRHKMTEALKDVYEAQLESKKQTNNLSTAEIEYITLSKGGYSLLFYRTAVNEKLSIPENEMLFHAGGLMQLCNDIFDIYKDRENKIFTLATTCQNIRELKKEFLQQLAIVQLKISQLPFATKNKERFFNMIDLAVFSRTEVCLQQLMQVQRKNGGFNLPRLSRSELICDMDTAKNKIKSTVYFLRH